MSKPKRKRKKHGGGGAAVTAPTPEAIAAELRDRADELDAIEDEHAAGPVWGAVHKLLLKARADPGEVVGVIARRDVAAVRTMAARLEGGTPAASAPAIADATATSEADGKAAPEFPAEDLRHAMRAFKKRLKLARLDQESRLGGRYTTGGRVSNIDAILPPNEFPPAIWEALVAHGQLRKAGTGFFALEDPGG